MIIFGDSGRAGRCWPAFFGVSRKKGSCAAEFRMLEGLKASSVYKLEQRIYSENNRRFQLDKFTLTLYLILKNFVISTNDNLYAFLSIYHFRYVFNIYVYGTTL